MNVLRVLIACLVAAVWAVVYLLAAFSHGKFSAPPELSGVMLAAVTFLFGSAATKSSRTSLRRRAAKVAKALKDDEPKEEA